MASPAISIASFVERVDLIHNALPVLVLVSFLLVSIKYIALGPSGKLPPGPRRKPIIGNLFGLPPSNTHAYKHWEKHHALYGPISSVSVFGQTIIILNELQCAIDLLAKRSMIYSDRRSSVFMKMAGWCNSFPNMNYVPYVAAIRKAVHKAIGTRAASNKYLEFQDESIRRMMHDIMTTPKNSYQHIRTMVGASALYIAYGYSVSRSSNDPLVDLAETGILLASFSALPGRWLVDMVPLLRFVPERFPGAGFKEVARQHREFAYRMLELPHAFVKHQMQMGVAKPSFTLNALDEGLSQEDEEKIKRGAVSIYGTASDTTTTMLHNFLLLMACHPDIQKKAQEELDRVVGNTRLPCYGDRPDLPYLSAIINETMRLIPIVPMNLPHVATQDDHYNGYFIPKGATVLTNIHEISRDPRMYSDPRAFKPERFLGDHPEPLPDFVFGFGQRVCSGKELFYQTAIITSAMLLSVFTVEPNSPDFREDSDLWEPGIAIRMKRLSCNFIPRSEQATTLVMAFDDSEYKSDEKVLLSCETQL
ncbi:putative cytochrome P450 oxidoreductase [Fistulina hepatica ATCC 64428]|uniref:Putative cytochrome P450 oxidoreductase n=1 Tax=Fistulina hepatica ATCC 64428 TaxID=1128425 RepID=A0A0D7ANZ8_9AGAR|nr:putative cytochrome P450 oxidoreductase [Fistulina hepatica ATCC 64428]